MFGEYALYVGNKVIALVCDETLFVKITDEGKTFVGEQYTEGFAYKGAKVSMQISENFIENREWLSELIEITALHLPEPKPKKKKR
jgi:TfoX/Sxy family transcriptional regulator of competence genes